MSPVVQQMMTLPELIERILGLTGKDPVRVREILSRGTLVHGPSRYRWEPLDTAETDLTGLLGQFPDAQPNRPFYASLCHLIAIRGRRGSIRLSRKVAGARRWLKKVSYWDILLEIFENSEPRYKNYSYTERADIYSISLSSELVGDLLSKGTLLKYTSLIEKIRYTEPTGADAFVER